MVCSLKKVSLKIFSKKIISFISFLYNELLSIMTICVMILRFGFSNLMHHNQGTPRTPQTNPEALFSGSLWRSLWERGSGLGGVVFLAAQDGVEADIPVGEQFGAFGAGVLPARVRVHSDKVRYSSW